MEEQKLSVTGLARKSGLSFNSIVRYRAGHIPNDYIIVVMLCIGLKINISKAEYLFRLALFSLGTDKCSLVYRLLINLSFVIKLTWKSISLSKELKHQFTKSPVFTFTSIYSYQSIQSILHTFSEPRLGNEIISVKAEGF